MSSIRRGLPFTVRPRQVQAKDAEKDAEPSKTQRQPVTAQTKGVESADYRLILEVVKRYIPREKLAEELGAVKKRISELRGEIQELEAQLRERKRELEELERTREGIERILKLLERGAA